MQTDRRAIFQLIAMGRITPLEAERLLMAWNEGRESRWALGALIAVFVYSQLNPGAGVRTSADAVSALFTGIWTCIHPVLLLLSHVCGGIQ